MASEEAKLCLGKKARGSALILKPAKGEKIDGAKWLVLSGNGYKSETEAKSTGIRAKKALMLSSAYLQLGVDCGSDRSTSNFTDVGKKWVADLFGPKNCAGIIYNDVHGLFVYEATEKQSFISTNADIRVGKGAKGFIEKFDSYLELEPELDERQSIALELLNGTFFEPTPTSRFVQCLTTVEVLCRRKKSQPVRKTCADRISILLGSADKAEFETLYEMRNLIVHEGKRPDAMDEAANKAYRLAWALLEKMCE